MIGRLEKTVVDCPDPRALAGFYAELLGMRVNEDEGDWVVIGPRPGDRHLAFQRATTWVPPRWPDPDHPRQLHLDIRVADVDAAEREVLALGGRLLQGESGTGLACLRGPGGAPVLPGVRLGSAARRLTGPRRRTSGPRRASPAPGPAPRVPRPVPR